MSEINYKKIAREIVRKQQDNIEKTITMHQTPDLYWKLEKAIEDALRFVANHTEEKLRNEIHKMIEDFDEKDGNTNH